MSAPIYYSSKDAGVTWPAPAAAAGGNGYSKRYEAIYHILKTCLVDGYPGKPGAGWSMVFDEKAAGTGSRYALTNASKSGILLIDQDYYAHCHVTVCESLPDIDSPIAAWSHGYSPENQATGKAHWWRIHNSTSWGTDDSEFHLVANENACYLMMISKSAYRESYQSSSAAYYLPHMYFGAVTGPDSLGTITAPELGNFIVLGGGAATLSDNTGAGQDHKFGYQSGTGTSVLTSTRDRLGAPRTTPPALVGFFPHQNQADPMSPDWDITHTALIPLWVGEISAKNVYMTYKLPVYVDALGSYFNTARKVAIAHGAVGCYDPYVMDGKNYVAFSANYRHPATHVSLDAEDWA